MIMTKQIGQYLSIATVCMLMSGCAWSVGGEKGGTTVHKPTKGMELIDLQKAHESGAISEEEYNQLKSDIVGK